MRSCSQSGCAWIAIVFTMAWIRLVILPPGPIHTYSEPIEGMLRMPTDIDSKAFPAVSLPTFLPR